jgi:hypothetical protein
VLEHGVTGYNSEDGALEDDVTISEVDMLENGVTSANVVGRSCAGARQLSWRYGISCFVFCFSFRLSPRPRTYEILTHPLPLQWPTHGQ